MSHPRHALIVFVLFVTPAVAQARQGRFEEVRSVPEHVKGLTHAETQQLVTALTRIEDVLRSNRAVRMPPPGVCTRLMTLMPGYIAGERVSMELSVQIPISFDDGVCHDISEPGVAISINDVHALFPGSRLDNMSTASYILPHRVSGGGQLVEYVDSYNRYLVFTRPGADLLLPLTTEQYLRERIRQVETAHAAVVAASTDEMIPDLERWKRVEKPQMEREFEAMMREMQGQVSDAELRQMRQNFEQVLAGTERTLRATTARAPLADSLRQSAANTSNAELDRLRSRLNGLDAAGRAAPACMAVDRPLDLGPCQENNRLVRVNPDYYDAGASRAAVQLLVVSSPLHVYERPAHSTLRRQMYETLDRAALQAVLMK